MAQRLAAVVRQEILLGDIGHIFRLLVFGEEMIEGLLLGRADLLGDRQPPLLRVRELRVDVEDDPPEGVVAVANHLPYGVSRLARLFHCVYPAFHAGFYALPGPGSKRAQPQRL